MLLYSVVYAASAYADADDIVQETFIYAYYHWGALRDKEKFSSWLCAIAKNKAARAMKRKGNLTEEKNLILDFSFFIRSFFLGFSFSALSSFLEASFSVFLIFSLFFLSYSLTDILPSSVSPLF